MSNLHSNSNSALPFEIKTGFVAVPNAVFAHYSFYPGFNGTVLRVYAFLLKNYNANFGYAFPTQDQAAQALAMSDKTFRKSVGVLKDVALVRVEQNKPYNNNVYYFDAPIEVEADFFARFPEAVSVKRGKDATWDKITPVRQESKARMTQINDDDFTKWL
jgi:hypothetical protein